MIRQGQDADQGATRTNSTTRPNRRRFPSEFQNMDGTHSDFCKSKENSTERHP
jgi:hypothetical protein